MPTMMSSSYRSKVGSRRLRTYFVFGTFLFIQRIAGSFPWSSFSATIIVLLEIMFWFVVLYVATLHCCKKEEFCVITYTVVHGFGAIHSSQLLCLTISELKALFADVYSYTNAIFSLDQIQRVTIIICEMLESCETILF